MKKGIVGFLLDPVADVASGCYSAVPVEMLRDHLNQVLEVLRDPALKGESGRKG